jgi:carbon storage regulator
MLVLSRHQFESIVIDGQIKITVVEIKGDKIRLGIEAPRDMPIWREELIASVKTEELALA